MRRLLGLTLLLAALLQLGVRGMQRMRSDVPMWDFVSVYSATRAWIHGGDPYDLPSVVKTWSETGIYSDRDVSYFATVYPPTSLVMLIPFAILPAGMAMKLWLLLTIALLILQFMALADMVQLNWRDSRILLLVGGALASAPLQFGILSGQLSIPAISICIIVFWCAGRGRDALAGALLGLACALKPQIAGPFVIYYLVLRRFRIFGFAALVGGILGGIALTGMQLSHINWIDGWRQSVAATTRIGGVNDYGWAGTFRDEIVDLKMLLVSLIHNPRILSIAVQGIVVALLAWYIKSFPRGIVRSSRTELLALAGLAAISILPVYHRVYDIALLTTALAWALAELDGAQRKHAIPLLIPMLVFLVPFDIVRSIGRRLPGLFEASNSGWWQTWIAPHYAWGLFLLTISLVWTLSRQASNKPANESIAAT